jgi:hypothetical protein
MQNLLSNIQATTQPRNGCISWGSGDGGGDGSWGGDTGGGPIQSDRVSNDYGGYSKNHRPDRPSGGKPNTPSHGSGSGSIIRAIQDKASANAFARFQNKKKNETNHALNRLSNAEDKAKEEINDNQKGQNTGFGGNDSYNDENPPYGGGGELYACLTCLPAQSGGGGNFGPNNLEGYFPSGSFEIVDKNTGTGNQNTVSFYFADPLYQPSTAPREQFLPNNNVTYAIRNTDKTFPGHTILMYEKPTRVGVFEINNVSRMRFDNDYIYIRVPGHVKGATQPQTHWIYYRFPKF